jgi:hypothetical protein
MLDATELSGVIGREREFQTTGMRRDEEAVCADLAPFALSAARIWKW